MDSHNGKYKYSRDSFGTHYKILEMISNNCLVLDIGCASGYLGEYLKKENKCKVWGVEPDKNSYEQAVISNSYEKVFNYSVDYFLSNIDLEIKFDVIILADVLEHLFDPTETLIGLKKYLNENGKIIISLPNIAYYRIRLALLLGSFNMTETGILDKTHLHFYTLKTARELIINAGYEITNIIYRSDLERQFSKIKLPVVGKLLTKFFPTFFSIQYIFEVKNQ